jgi:altronate hydrolase
VLAGVEKTALSPSELVVATVCGGSDGTSGITANPAVGLAFDRLVQEGATAIFEEPGELIGCEPFLAGRAVSGEVRRALLRTMTKTREHYTMLGHGSFAPGNAEGGLTTIEEKSLGAYAKSGSMPISGVLEPGELPPSSGLYLLDIIPEGPVRFGFPNINDNAEIAELMACGAHLTLFTTGRGSVVGSAISPIIKICANPATYRRMSEDMDVNAGRVLEGASLDEVADDIVEAVWDVAGGKKSASESLGHKEFVLTYKAMHAEPSCLTA